MVAMEIQVLELKKIPEKVKGEDSIISWMRFLGGKTREEFEDMAEKNKYIGIAYEELQKLSADEIKRLEYEGREKAIRDHKSFMKGAMEQGLEQGIQLGGHNKLKEIMKKKLRKGMELEQIAEDLEEDPETIRGIYEEIIAENANAKE